MAEIWPDEGLDIVLNIFPRGGANLTTTYLALFTAFTATTVGTDIQGADAYTEPAGGAYARQSIANTAWGAIAESATAGVGRRTTAAQVTFPTATAAWGTVNGFWLANILSATGDAAIFAANFDDATAISPQVGDVVKVTPTVQYNH